MSSGTVRGVGVGLVLTTGCLTAMLLHIALQFEGAHGIGAGMSGAYAHVLVMPLLCGSVIAVGAMILRYVLRGWNACKRSQLFHLAAERVVTAPSARVIGLIAASALVTLVITEQSEQFISLGHSDPSLPLGTALSFGFVAQLLGLSAAVAALLRAVLVICFIAAHVVGTVLAALYQPLTTRRTPETLFAPEPITGLLLRLLTRSIGRRAPPQLQTA